jgi:hypothetical protein
MSAGWIEVPLFVLGLGLAGCEVIVAEPPPPPSRNDIPSAPPGARGARAAGTEAAPKPFSRGSDGAGEPEPGEEELPPADAGTERQGKEVPL